MRRITIDPVTRLEGHAKIEIFLDDGGEVKNAYFQVPELRGFEKFCEGRPAEEMPRITPRICGVCPEAHHMASTKALDCLFKVEPPPAAKKLRELFYCAHMIHSHIAHFYALAAADFVLGPDADPAVRNILGVVGKVGTKIGKEVLRHRAYAQEIQALIGGKATHPVCGVPGGMTRPMSQEERQEVVKKAESCVDFARFSLDLFNDVVLGRKDYVDLITKGPYGLVVHSMGLVDAENRVNFYEGKVRVVDTEGKEILRFTAEEYLDHIGEYVEPWTYLKFPFLRKKGWKGLVEGRDTSLYRVGPLGRLNAAEGMATPLAHEAYEKMFETLGGRPVHATLAQHWARLVELLYAAERMLELAQDPEVASKEIRNLPSETPREGIGVVEAPRGTLFHHYVTDEKGILTGVNLVVATVHNHGAICISVKKAAQGLISGGEVNQGLLNMVEMAFRAYDPCFGCATHYLPGGMPLEVAVYDSKGRLVQRLRR